MTNEEYHKHDETNRLIAEFMGLPENNPSEYLYNDNHIRDKNDLDYHKSWDWLMPVVHRCLLIAHNEMLNEWENSFADVFLTASIDTMHKEVVDFIKWYNENKQQ